jgi:hypothetical protein
MNALTVYTQKIAALFACMSRYMTKFGKVSLNANADKLIALNGRIGIHFILLALPAKPTTRRLCTQTMKCGWKINRYYQQVRI